MDACRLISTAFAVTLAAAQAMALPNDATERTQMFAACTGRLSAVMEHQWLMGDPKADETEEMRAYFISLLEASMAHSTQDPRDILHLRIETKLAHASLLSRATFSDDPRVSRAAARMAARYVQSCRSLLLS